MRISDSSSDVCSSDLAFFKDRSLTLPASARYRAGAPQPLGRCLRNRGRAISEATPSPLPQPHTRVSPREPGRSPVRTSPRRSTHLDAIKIGRASLRERVCQYVSISVVADSLKNTTINKYLLYKESSSRH